MAKENKMQYDFKNICKKVDLYEKFSCKPTQKKYKEGFVFDEDKSVKWNREEVLRRNNLHDEEVKDLNRKKNAMLQDITESVLGYIQQETKVPKERAQKIWAYLTEKYHANGLYECLAHLDDLLEIFK